MRAAPSPTEGAGALYHPLVNDQTFASHLAAVRTYLCSRRWQRDPSSGQCQLYVFNSDVNELARAFHDDKGFFPKSSVCALLTNPAGDLLALAVEVIAPELFPGELSIVHDALEAACAIRDADWRALAVAVAVPAAVAGVGYLVQRNRADPGFDGAVLGSGSRPSRPPQQLVRPSRL